MNNVVAIIQARMGASRLPNKMLLNFKGYPTIEWVYRRVSRAKRIDSVVAAIPFSPNDDVLAKFLKSLGAQIFRGSEQDVVDRFCQAAMTANATHVVRICADNPLICPQVIDDLIDFYFSHQVDYAYNHISRGNLYPDGLGAEMVSFSILRKIFENAQQPEQREHVFNYIWDNQDKFRIETFNPPQKVLCHPEIKLDIDRLEDLQYLTSLDVSMDMSGEEIIHNILKKGK